MVKTPSNTIVGAPATVTVTPWDASSGAVDLGSTDGGVKLNYNPEHFFAEADQWLGKIAGFKVGEDATVEMTLNEPTQANLAYVFGQPLAAASGGTFDLGGNATVTYWKVIIVGVGPGACTRTVTLHKCVFVGNPEITFHKKNKQMVKLTIQLIQDTSLTANKQLLDIVDTGADTTPPTVAMTTPADKATWAVKTTKTALVLTFTEATNKIDESTLVYGDTIIISNIEDITAPAIKAGTIVYNAATKTLVFTPTDAWTTAYNFAITISTRVRDTAGNCLAATFYGSFVID
jgi:hypothetical protein